eukprot:766666-Hanusia_phi.AAC.1
MSIRACIEEESPWDPSPLPCCELAQALPRQGEEGDADAQALVELDLEHVRVGHASHDRRGGRKEDAGDVAGAAGGLEAVEGPQVVPGQVHPHRPHQRRERAPVLHAVLALAHLHPHARLRADASPAICVLPTAQQRVAAPPTDTAAGGGEDAIGVARAEAE